MPLRERSTHQEGATPAAERPRQHPPLTDYGSYLAPKGSYEVAGQFPELVTNVGAFSFASLVHAHIQLLAELE